MARSRSSKKKKVGLMDDVMVYVTQAIDETDEQAAAGRVAALREEHPDASSEELVEALIRRKCKRTGAVGAVTSGAAMVPGLGTVASLTFGVAADIGMTFKMQAELVLEIAAVYERPLTPDEKRNAVLLVTGISAGANQALGKAGARVAEKATERLAQKSVAKAIPVLGVAASAGTNVVSTYIIGRRANAYFSLGPEAVGDWAESARAIVGVDERKLINWLAETTENSWTQFSNGVQDLAGAVIVAGKSAGELVVVSAGRAGQAIAGAGKSVAEGVGKAGKTVTSAGKSAVEGAGDLSRKAGESVVAGVGKAGEAVADAGKSVAEGAGKARKRVVGVLKGFKRGQKSHKPATTPDDEPGEPADDTKST